MNAGEYVEQRECLLNCWWECKLVQPLWKTACRFIKKLKLELSYDVAIRSSLSVIKYDAQETVK